MSTPNGSKKSAKGTLDDQYGGNNKSGWMAYLPEHWLPYIQLARLSPPVGLVLIFLPYAFGLVYAAIRQHLFPADVAQAAVPLLCWSFFFSNGIHVWNDIVDAPLDAQVERTRKRPIPRGAVSTQAALVFAASQLGLGATTLRLILHENSVDDAVFGLPGIVLSFYYPYAKRHTYWTQVVLGLCLSWGIFIGALSVGVTPYARETGEFNIPLLLLFAACTMWTMIYDSVYGFQDLKDDLKSNIKSMPVLFRFRIKPVFWVLLVLIELALGGMGRMHDFSLAYYGIAVGGTAASLGLMIARVDLESSKSCWIWFSKGFWYAGGAIIGGLLAEYATRLVGA